jgi:hypothetical protein
MQRCVVVMVALQVDPGELDLECIMCLDTFSTVRLRGR